MDKTNSKILTLSFAIVGALSGFTIHLLIKSFSAAFGWMARLSDSDIVRHIVPVVVGFGVFFILQLNKNILTWGDEVVVEIRKVVWPSRKDTTAMTIVVIIMVFISSFIIALMDVASSAVLKSFIR